MRRSATIRILASGSLLALAACASRSTPAPNPTLEQAQAAMAELENDPSVARYAPAELHEARGALARAMRSQQSGDSSETTHLAYLALRRIEIAQATARSWSATGVKGPVAERGPPPPGREIETVPVPARGPEPPTGSIELSARQTPYGVVVTLEDVLFAPDGTALDPRAGASIDQLAALARERPGRAIRIEGHTDDIGNRTLSLDLAHGRAEAVRAALVQRGIDAERMDIRAFGPAYPIASNETSLGRQMNRRIEVIILENEAESGQAAPAD